MSLIKNQNLISIILATLLFSICMSLPLDDLNSQKANTVEDSNDIVTSSEEGSGSSEEDYSNLNKSQHLYVVKAVVYEIGILTETDDNDTTSSEETHERVDLTFFDAHTNASHIDLGNIPLPVQTNISGQVLTGIAPINIGAISSPADILSTLPLTGTIVNITHSDTAFFKLSRHNTTDLMEDISGASLTESLGRLRKPIRNEDDRKK